MDEALNAEVQKLKDEMIAATHEVTAAHESDEEKRQIDTYDRVEALAGRIKAFFAGLDEKSRAIAQRHLERRLIDLRRDAAQLTKRVSGAKAERAIDAGQPFLMHRAPPKSIEPPRAAPTRNTPKFRVGGETEAWCGKCREFTEHSIFAMVGDQPKQVICGKCQSRHSYRTEPSARSVKEMAQTPAKEAPAAQAMRMPVDPEAARRAEAKKALERELQAAENVRPYDPRERYRQNDIVQHPEHGRGKVENVLRGSMLVRFRDGLRPLNLK